MRLKGKCLMSCVSKVFRVMGPWFLVATVLGCGGGYTPPPPSPPQPATSYFTGSGSGLLVYQSMTVLKSTLNGSNISTLGLNWAWTLHAGNQLMDFAATPTAPWLTITPTYGTLSPGGSTAIGVVSIDASQAPNARSVGGIQVSAPGYSDDVLIGVELNCSYTSYQGLPACVIAYTSDPSHYPLP